LLVFGHTGITLGAVTLINGLVTGAVSKREKTYPLPEPDNNAPGKSLSGGLFLWFARLGHMDLRILLVGSLLPDIIDKPLGHILLREYLSSGRIYAHTLLFVILITLGGFLIRYRTGKTWLLVLSLGTFIHLILDEMWLPEWRATLLWPLYGLEFPKAELTGWVGNLWDALLHEPAVYVPEIIGAVIIIVFLWVLIRNGNLTSFLKRGHLSDTGSTPQSP
jgi:inner membrane protein